MWRGGGESKEGVQKICINHPKRNWNLPQGVTVKGYPSVAQNLKFSGQGLGFHKPSTLNPCWPFALFVFGSSSPNSRNNGTLILNVGLLGDLRS